MRRKYSVLRTTRGLKVPYYVKENFHTEYQGSLQRLEISVEEEYVLKLRHDCFREKNYSKYFARYSRPLVFPRNSKERIEIIIQILKKGT